MNYLKEITNCQSLNDQSPAVLCNLIDVKYNIKYIIQQIQRIRPPNTSYTAAWSKVCEFLKPLQGCALQLHTARYPSVMVSDTLEKGETHNSQP